jgi:hypothetical protein
MDEQVQRRGTAEELVVIKLRVPPQPASHLAVQWQAGREQ